MKLKYSVYVERVGAEVAECACVIGLPEVKVILKPLKLNLPFLLLAIQIFFPIHEYLFLDNICHLLD